MLVIKPENCDDLQWLEPVTVQLRYGLLEEIYSPLQALNCLSQRWPKVGGLEFERAKEACMAALEAKIPCESARYAFLNAAEEADVLYQPSLMLTLGVPKSRRI
ncbi:DUF982 domain-containing protein [Pararhizobium sp.]|uniref:DUF982 domain-containing protein n=1 Tax=Pararhizobium sp. TaxID=1977563 RepID=UPI003BA8C251